jgi:serine-aspartate repeat-containing protein C/D/E
MRKIGLIMLALFMFGCGDNTTSDDDENGDTTMNSSDSDSDTDSDSDSDSDTDSDTDSDSDSDSDTDSDSGKNDPVEPTGDECNSTTQCQAKYDSAIDCQNSTSDTSRCLCTGNVECWTLEQGSVDTDTLGQDTGASSNPYDTDEPNGKTGVYIEVESISPVFPWVEETSKTGYYGTGYFRWPDENDGPNGITDSQNAVLNYDFSIGTSGTYLFEVRGRRDHEGWCETAKDDACNDIWVKIDNGKWTKKMIKQNTWAAWVWDPQWEPGSSVIKTEVNLTQGSHSYSISGRSNGVKIDAIRIYLKGTTAPAP